jgi:hypothetical protein
MEKRINKVLLLVTIALLGPIGMGAAAAAASPTAPQTEGWAEASSAAEASNAAQVAPSASLTITIPKTQNSKLKTQNFLTHHWTYAVATTLYVLSACAFSAVTPLTPLVYTGLRHHLGSSAGGLPLLYCRFKIADCRLWLAGACCLR